MTSAAWWLVIVLMIGPNWQEGLAVRYAPGLMAQVARNRGIEPQLCMIAYTYARDEDMGKLWLEVEGIKTGIKRRCLVVDLPREKDRVNLVRRNILVEIDAASSVAICSPSWRGKASECPVRVRKIQVATIPQRRAFHAY